LSDEDISDEDGFGDEDALRDELDEALTDF